MNDQKPAAPVLGGGGFLRIRLDLAYDGGPFSGWAVQPGMLTVQGVLESALARAEETLPDRQRFGLDAERWAAFQAALDAPARPNPGLKKLLQTPSVFERRRR